MGMLMQMEVDGKIIYEAKDLKSRFIHRTIIFR